MISSDVTASNSQTVTSSTGASQEQSTPPQVQMAAASSGVLPKASVASATRPVPKGIGAALSSALARLDIGVVTGMKKVTQILKLLLSGKNNQYHQFLVVMNELIRQVDETIVSANKIRDPAQIHAMLEEVKSALQTAQTHAATLDELSNEQNKQIKPKIVELEDKLRIATNTLAAKYAALIDSSQFQEAKTEVQKVIKEGEPSLDDLLGCIEVEASHALGRVNFKSDVAAAEANAQELQNKNSVSAADVTKTLELAAAAEQSRAQTLASFTRSVAAAPNMSSSLLDKAKNSDGFRSLIRDVLQQKNVPGVIGKAKADGDQKGIDALKLQNQALATQKNSADHVAKTLTHPETIDPKLSARQKAFMAKVNRTINNDVLPPELKKLIQEMAGRVLTVLEAIENVTTEDSESKKLLFTGAKMNKSQLFGLAQTYSDFCDFYVCSYEVQHNAMKNLNTVEERGNIFSQTQAAFNNVGFDDLFTELRDVTIVPSYDHFRDDVCTIVGPAAVLKCVRDLLEAWQLYKKMVKLLEHSDKIEQADREIEGLIKQKAELEQLVEEQEAAPTS